MLQASYLMLVEYNGEAKNVGTSELMIYNAMWSVPALVMVGLESTSLMSSLYQSVWSS